jgi:hypothetical protein
MHEPLKHAEVRQKVSHTTLGIVGALLIQGGSIIWFAATLNNRVDHIETQQQQIVDRMDREVIPRADLTQRLDRIEKSLDQIMDRLIQHPQQQP